MSRIDLSHISKGRTPWRRIFQLRPDAPAKLAELRPVLTLSSAARNAEPPTYFSSWQRDEAKHRLLVLCEWLDDRLEKPAHVTALSKGARRVTVFDSLAYSIYTDDRFIISGTLQNGHYEASNFAFEVGRPLLTSWWLRPVLKNLNLAETDQGDLIFDAAVVDDLAQWLSDSAYRLLVRNPIFQEFRRHGLPRLFKLPKDIYSIALASRTNPVGPLLESRTLNDVWRNDRAYRQVARENSHLLPLLQAFVEQIPSGKTVQTKDPILTLKSAFRDAGLSEAAWRYVVRHGSRLFKIPWAITKGQKRLEVAIRYMEALDIAGLPPPPPPTVVKAFLHGYNPHRQDDAILGEHFQHLIDPVALRAGLIEADLRRQEGNVEGFDEEFLGVCWWSEGLNNLLDANQAKAGWQWFVRRWQEAEAEQALLEDTEQLHWVNRLQEFRLGRMRIVPIESSEELIRESLSMRNCLQSYVENCAGGNFEVYSVRFAATGKRKGCVGIRFDSDGIPTIADVKGFANTPPTGEVLQVAADLFWKLQQFDLE
jgi:hypothetical protein